MQPTFFSADHHFGHRKVIEYSKRPFANADEMDEALIRAWNEKVPTNGIVYYLGDFSLHKRERTIGIRSRLHGLIYCVKGNHDPDSVWFREMFGWVKEKHYTKGPNGVKVVLNHFPELTWDKCHRGSWMLHGHSHGNLRPPPSIAKQRRMDIGVDTHPNYAPYSWEEIARYMAKKEHVSIDHH